MKELTFEITGKCNRNCWWCSSSSDKNGKHMQLETILLYLKEFRESCDIIRLSGGEPTLHPEIVYICRHAKEELDYKKIILLTNGSNYFFNHHIDEYYVSALDKKSEHTIELLKHNNYNVTVTGVIGTHTCKTATKIGWENDIPIHLYQLQYQGRAKGIRPMKLTIGGIKCMKHRKITISHDKFIYECSGEKDGHICNVGVIE